MRKLENELTNKCVIDLKSGEIECYLTNKEDKILRRMRTTASVLNDNAYKRNYNLTHEYIKEELGSFYFNYYNELIHKKHLFRFMYLCTYSNYKNYIVLGNQTNEGKLATKKDIKEILKLKDQQFYDTYNYFIENNMITENNEKGYIKINECICKRGEIKKNNNKKEVIRMFDNAIKEIYEKSKASEHNKLDLLIKLLEYVHFDMNIICKNPTEKNIDLIERITLTELAKMLGYSSTQRLRRSLFDLRVNDKKVIMIAKFDNKVDMIVVNPAVFYAGNDIKRLEYLIDLFRIADRPI